MSGLTRYLMLTARAKTGLSATFPLLLAIAAVAAIAAFFLLNVTLYVYGAQAFGALLTAAVMTVFYGVLCVILVLVAFQVQRSTMQQARQALAARSTNPLFDTSMLSTAMQVGRTIGLKRVVPIAAVVVIAVGLAREWRGHVANRDAHDDY